MKTQTKKLLITAVFISCLGSFAKADLAKRINSIISRSSQRKVQYSIRIIRADSGKTVYSHNAKKAMVPASNMKIIVSAAALRYLGPNYEYKTKVGLCGNTLVVIGSGDPLLGDKATDTKYSREAGWIFENIAAALKRNGVTTIKDIIVDSSIFDDQRVHPNWPKEELNRWYACEVSGLNFNGNCIEVTATNKGGRAVVSIEPKTGFVKVINKVKAISKGKSAVGSYRQPEPNKIIIKGKCRKKAGPFDVAIERPAAFFGFLLHEHLTRQGINTQGRLIEKTIGRDCNFRVLTEYSSPMADCLARCNKNSFGLAAEALLKTIAANVSLNGKNGSWAGGREIIGEYLLKLGIEGKEFYIDDGSGLSRQNKLSANSITRVLLAVCKSKDWRLYKSSLAVGGVDGTIRKYFKEKKYKGKIFGKTGYVNRVKSFSGVCNTAGGDYIFSILANNTNGKTRKAINDIAKAIIDSE
jgi:D-alanyl-D-alanine carboxypeptidase/D-alanyl-D-alanine-endopeptidase (penicillin-binding protein 4)